MTPDPKQGWRWVLPDLEGAPPFLWITIQSGAVYDEALPQRIQRFIAMGGTVFLESGAGSQETLRKFREKVFC